MVTRWNGIRTAFSGGGTGRNHAAVRLLMAMSIVVAAGCAEGVFDSDSVHASSDAGSDVSGAKPYTPEQYADWRKRFDEDENFQELKLRDGVVTVSPAQANAAVVEPDRIVVPSAGNSSLLKIAPGTVIFGDRADPQARKAAGGTNVFGFVRRVVATSQVGATIVIDTAHANVGELLEGAAQVKQVPENLVLIDTTGVDMQQYFPDRAYEGDLDVSSEVALDPFELGGEFSKTFGGSFTVPALNMKLSKSIPGGSLDLTADVYATLKLQFKPTIIAKFIFGYFSLDYMKLALGMDFLVGGRLDYDAAFAVVFKADNDKKTPEDAAKAIKGAGPQGDKKKFSLARVGPFVGPVLGPVPTTWQIRLIAECTVSFAGTAKGHSEAEVGAGGLFGVEYDGTFKTILEGNFKTYTDNSVTLGGSMGVECALEPRFEWLVAGVGGPWIGVRGSVGAGLKYQTECEDPVDIPEDKKADASLAASVDAAVAVKIGLGADFGIFGSYEKVLKALVDEKWNLWEHNWFWKGLGIGSCKTACYDGQTNGYETAGDCGGKVCAKRCVQDQACTAGTDCKSKYCINNKCSEDYCLNKGFDAFFPVYETDVDCGGNCEIKCANDKKCELHGDCQSGYCDAKTKVCKESNCEDGAKGPKEADVDCGGVCPKGCELNQVCNNGADCASKVCAQGLQVCAPPNACYATIFDKKKDGDETFVDCGGACAALADKWAPPLSPAQAYLPVKPAPPTFLCPPKTTCKTDPDCLFSKCDSGVCTGKCDNGIQDDDEPTVDCGKSCAKCKVGNACFGHDDCGASLCIDSVCTKHVCANGVQDGDETDLDCGGSCPIGCKTSKNCDVDTDCSAELQCNPVLKTCQSRCTNKVKDAVETDVDCGGLCGKTCHPGQSCKVSADCKGASAFCNAKGVCAQPGCWDGTKNFFETDADCGGGQCIGCGVGMACKLHKDCKSGTCTEGVCVGDACTDGWLSPGEVGVDCGPACNKSCPLGSPCKVDAECTSGWCDGSFCVASFCENKSQTSAKGESDVDCGAGCGGCELGQKCTNNVDCASLVCNKTAGVCAASTCLDGKLTFGEADVDCGGPCQQKCPQGDSCKGNDDCQSSSCNGGTCGAADCFDGKWSQAEGDVDCGAVCAAKCGPGKQCKSDGDCASKTCSNGVCSGALCKNGSADGGETDIDCGGPCAIHCKTGQGCKDGADCQSGACNGTTCVSTTCEDGAKTGTESDVDCGGSCTKRCANGKTCKVAKDCISNQCLGGVCGVPGCLNNKLDFGEADVDCGGKSCPLLACKLGQQCSLGSDCATGFCTAGTCSIGSCKTKSKEGDETDVDCGGSCAPCAQGKACAAGADCQSKLCLANTCVPALCANGSKNAGEGGVDCGGVCAQKCQIGKLCSASSDCASGYCAAPGLCAAPTCGNATKDAGESDTDCGAICGGNCKVGATCASGLDCLSGRCDSFAKTCTTSTCFDGGWTKGEADIDCGGACQAKCALNKACTSAGDCASGACDGQHCVANHCLDKHQSVDETDVDCGGTTCTGCGLGEGCALPSDCTSSQCDGVVCVATACENNGKDGDETDVDCGGSCKSDCLNGQGCKAGADCQSGVCNGKTCVTTTCFDKVLSAGESDVDCSGPCNARCLSGKKCGAGTDCISGVCSKSGLCVLSQCSDEIFNGKETDIDCGGGCANGCGFGKACNVSGDCTSGSCGTSGVCVKGPCDDGVKGGGETDVDCGGVCSATCALGKACKVGGDCTSKVCSIAGLCVASACDDGVLNGDEGDIDCGGSCSAKCATGKACGAGGDCATGFCASDDKVCVASACLDQALSAGETDVDCGGNCAIKCGAAQSCGVDGDCAVGQCVQGKCGCPTGYKLSGASCVDVDECSTAAASPQQVGAAADLLALAKLQEQQAVDASASAQAVVLSSAATLSAATDACVAKPTPVCDEQVSQLTIKANAAIDLAAAAKDAVAAATKATAAAQGGYDEALTLSGLTLAGCSGDAACKNTVGSFTCTCNSGYKGDGKACGDIDECVATPAVCSADASCANSAGSYTCTCNKGYAGDGKTCTDIDECKGGAEAVCGAFSTCTNLPGGFGCGCQLGHGNCDDAVDNGCEATLTSDVDHCGGCGKACDDNACTVGDSCADSVCVPGAVTACDDGLGCTADSCDPKAGCAHLVAADSSSCSDGDACTVGDACKTGACVAGPKANCDDSNDCTVDACDKVAGCSHKDAVGALCDGTVVGSRCYKPVQAKATWSQAQAACEAWGGDLVAIGSGEENDAVRGLVAYECPNNNALIGLTDSAVEGTFAWADGTALSYTNWNDGEPNDSGGDEDIAEMTTTGKWNDNSGGYQADCYVCERPHVEPKACEDGNPCTINDSCKGKTCQAGETNPCSDGDLCTAGVCDAKTGCKQSFMADGAMCGAGGICASGHCIRAGLITSTPGPVCKLGQDKLGELDGTVVCSPAGLWSQIPQSHPDYQTNAKPFFKVKVPGKIKGFQASSRQYCVLLQDGTVWCNGPDKFIAYYEPGQAVEMGKLTKVEGLPGPATKIFVNETSGYYRIGCALVSGSLYCWGHVGALGDAAPTNLSPTAVKLQNLPTDILDFQLGSWGYNSNKKLYGVMLTEQGDVYRWGTPLASAYVWPWQKLNGSGQFVKGLAQMSATQRACGILANGTVTCWGAVNPALDFWTDVALAKDVINVDSAFESYGKVGTCALLASGAVFCGGFNGYGQRGDGSRDGADLTTGHKHTFFKVPLPADAVDILNINNPDSGLTCAALSNGAMACWGARSAYNGASRLPNDPPARDNSALTALDLPSATKALVPIGGAKRVMGACAIDTNNIPQCWGPDTTLAISTSNTRVQLATVPLTAGTAAVQAIAAAQCGRSSFPDIDVQCKVGMDGKAFCWGTSLGASVVQDNLGAAAVDVAVQGINVQFNFTGGCNYDSNGTVHHRCYLMVDGSVRCAGGNACGQLGIGHNNQVDPNQFFTPAGFDKGMLKVALPMNAMCGLRSDGKVLCAGRGAEGQQGNNNSDKQVTPSPVAGIDNAKDIAASAFNVCAVRADGTVSCWGAGIDKALGSTNYNNTASPITVQAYNAATQQTAALQGASKIAATQGGFCAVATGGVWCWGAGIMHQGSYGAARLIDKTAGATVVYGGVNSENGKDANGAFCANAPTGSWSCWGPAASDLTRRRYTATPVLVNQP